MKQYCLFILLITMMLSSCKNSNDTLDVITFNIRNGKANDKNNSWVNRRHATINMIEMETPDIFGLQEAFIDQVEFIAENCPNYNFIAYGRDDGEKEGEMMAVFYDYNRFTLLDEGNFWLSETPEKPSLGWDGACRREATWLNLKDNNSDKNILFLNTHLDHVGLVAREESILLIKDKIKEMSDENTIVVLIGDFNTQIDDFIFMPLEDYMLEARSTSIEKNDIATYNGWKEPMSLIDFIFYRNAEAVSCFTLTDDYGASFISDHYPVKVVLKY